MLPLETPMTSCTIMTITIKKESAIAIRYWASMNHQYSLLRALPEKTAYFLRQVLVASIIEGMGLSPYIGWL